VEVRVVGAIKTFAGGFLTSSKLEVRVSDLRGGLLVRRDESLELVIKPVWQVIGIEEQAVFLQRMTAKKSIFGD
jgi:hypothetical protein